MRKLLTVAAAMAVWSLAGCAAMTAAAGTLGIPTPTNELKLRQDMRSLWADHVIWTRQFIVATVADDPSATTALNRLMRNQEDLGNAIAPFYGAAAGTSLTNLLKQHISIAGELLTAAKAGNSAGQANADRRWHNNAAEIASFLAGANPNWSRDMLLQMLNEHLALTTREAVARLQRNWTEDQRTFDSIFDQAMSMADDLSAGIVKQFPARF